MEGKYYIQTENRISSSQTHDTNDTSMILNDRGEWQILRRHCVLSRGWVSTGSTEGQGQVSPLEVPGLAVTT